MECAECEKLREISPGAVCGACSQTPWYLLEQADAQLVSLWSWVTHQMALRGGGE